MEDEKFLHYLDGLLDEGRLKLQRCAFGRALHKRLKHCGPDYDYSNDQAVIGRTAKTLSYAKTPEERETAIATIRTAWWVLYLYFLHERIGRMEKDYETLMQNARKAMSRENITPLISTGPDRVSSGTRGRLAQVVRLPIKS